MAVNKSNNEEESKWYKLPLRDWAIIIGFAAYYVNSAGANATYNAKVDMIFKEMSDIKTLNKESDRLRSEEFRNLEKKVNEVSTQNEVLKQRIESLERK